MAPQLKTERDRQIWTAGFCVALAEVHRGSIEEAASAAGITIAEAKKVGVDAYDTAELKKAGIR